MSQLCLKGLVAERKADFHIADWTVRKDRANVVDYLITDSSLSVGHFYTKNPQNTYDWIVFFQPLYLKAWIGLVLFSVLIPILIAFIVFYRELQSYCIFNNVLLSFS